MTPPPVQKCSVPGCLFVTPEDSPTWEILTTYLNDHTQAVHIKQQIPKKNEVLFSFRHSNYEDILGCQISSIVNFPKVKNNSDLGENDFHIMCSDGEVVVLNKLVLVLLHPFYQNILLDRDITALILPDISIDQLMEDFFGRLTSFCGMNEDADQKIEDVKSELVYPVTVDIQEVKDEPVEKLENGGKNGLTEGNQQLEVKLDQTIVVSLMNNEKDDSGLYSSSPRHQQSDSINDFDHDIDSSGKDTTHPTLPVRQRGRSICPQCQKAYNNRAKPYICECGCVLGGSFDPFARDNKCPNCDYHTKSKFRLKIHFGALHGNATYACTFCEFKSGYKQALKQHVQSQHEGAMYPCDECDFKSKYKSGIFHHVKVVHRGFRYVCEYCGHEAKGSSELRKHELVRHKEEIKNREDKRRRNVYRSKTSTIL